MRRLAAWLIPLTLALLALGLAVGSQGLALDWGGAEARLIVGEIRAPRTLAAWLVGALLGLAGAVAQGVFRNPLAEPYLLGAASGAVLGVVLMLALLLAASAPPWLAEAGQVAAAFVGALAGVLLTLTLARGTAHTTRLLLAGVVVGVMLGAVGDLITTFEPEVLRGKQAFLLGSTAFIGWRGVAWLAAGLVLTLPLAWRLSRVLDALTLGEDGARSLGLALSRWRAVLVGVLALTTALAVAQAGLVAFVGLVAPHLVRRMAPTAHGPLLLASSATGGALLLAADVLARALLAPQELPVGVLTAALGGGYLIWLLRRRQGA